MEPNALHIWPRGNYMCIALPNTEKTFTVTLFLPLQGEPAFSKLPDATAAHAMVPFHGQGMNCAFEDCVSLARHIAEGQNWEGSFAAFEGERRPNAEAIQQMALENYIEMRDKVDDADFLLRRQLERVLAERHPGVFVPRYSMVTFMRIPYSVAWARGEIQRGILMDCCEGKARIDDIDLDRADALVRVRLEPLDA